jgi:predicted MFS family arabinose efflux permease
MKQNPSKEKLFSSYQIFMIAILSLIQFSVILDFMVLSPLGALLMEKLNVNTSQFGLVVSAYAFSAGASGLLAAGFADKFDRKKLLLFFYVGFILGTALCAMAPSYSLLLFARIFTGLFGGVIGSISFAIISDLFQMQVRGRVMGFVQMAFAASQVLGIPIGLLLANSYGWHSPFWMIAVFSVVVGIVILIYMQPITQHLAIKSNKNPFQHLAKTISQPAYLRAFLATTLLATGGFMLMPFGSAFCIHNIGLNMNQLPILYSVTGVFSIAFGPFIGKFSDRLGKYKMFVIGSILSMIMVVIYTNIGTTPLWLVITINVVLFVGIASRMISASALMTAIPEPQDRGAFMSINSSVQQISGGIASAIAGLIVIQTSTGALKHYDTLGYVVVVSMIIAMAMMYTIDKYVKQKAQPQKTVVPTEDELLPV